MSVATRLEALLDQVNSSPSADAAEKQKLVDDIQEAKAELKAYEKDVIIYRIAVITLHGWSRWSICAFTCPDEVEPIPVLSSVRQTPCSLRRPDDVHRRR